LQTRKTAGQHENQPGNGKRAIPLPASPSIVLDSTTKLATMQQPVHFQVRVMFQIKVCGITNVIDAKAAVAAGADAIGLNFYRPSKRYVTAARAQAILDSLAGQIRAVALFANEASAEINEMTERLDIETVQLHGDESAVFLTQLRSDLTIIRARRLDRGGIDTLEHDLKACEEAGRAPDAILIDSLVPGEFGGTGHTAKWNVLAANRHWHGELPLILAGGLTPGNVATAISQVQPSAVDVASGVEKSPGVKDAALMRAFAEQAAAAFAAL
jgi:phosphoribosylanthranilate isomerase